jgi:hypothetical protein
MLKNIMDTLIPHAAGIGLMIMGWYFSILNVGLVRFQTDILLTKWTGIGLLMIICGAYLPWIWIKIRSFFSKD